MHEQVLVPGPKYKAGAELERVLAQFVLALAGRPSARSRKKILPAE